MNLNIFTPIDLDKIAKLPFIERTVPYIYAETKFVDGPIYYGALHIINDDAYNKLSLRLAGTDHKIEAGARVYVLPNCAIPQFKIKEILKSLKAVFTNDWTTATAFLGSEATLKEFSNTKETMNLLGGLTYYNVYDTFDKQTSSIYPEIYNNAKTFYMNKSAGAYISNNSNWVEFRFMVPLGANIMYRVLSEKLPIISEKSLLSQGTETSIIDDEMYLSLKDMLSSQDEEHNAMALHTISNCNIKESMIYIYLIAKQFAHIFRNSRFKNIKLFYSLSKMDDLEDMSQGSFISKMLKEDPDKITPELFRTMVNTAAENLIDDNSIKSDLFDIIIIPKRKFAKLHDNLTFTYELDDE